jgi:hypothetical protein
MTPKLLAAMVGWVDCRDTRQDGGTASAVNFWANDDAVELARGLRSALDKVHVKPGGA